MYSIHVEQESGLIQVELAGMIGPDEVDAYIVDLKREFVRHRLHGYVMVIDVTGCPIQTQDMIGLMGQHMATMPKARALAVVTGSSLARMQVRRLFTQPYARITATVAEGRAWVLSGTEPLAA